MAEYSRRLFLKNASVGAAVVGAAVVVSPRLSGPAKATEAPSVGPVHGGPFLAWVKNGEVAVLVGEQTLVHQDAQLATRLAQLAAQIPQP